MGPPAQRSLVNHLADKGAPGYSMFQSCVDLSPASLKQAVSSTRRPRLFFFFFAFSSEQKISSDETGSFSILRVAEPACKGTWFEDSERWIYRVGERNLWQPRTHSVTHITLTLLHTEAEVCHLRSADSSMHLKGNPTKDLICDSYEVSSYPRPCLTGVPWRSDTRVHHPLASRVSARESITLPKSEHVQLELDIEG